MNTNLKLILLNLIVLFFAILLGFCSADSSWFCLDVDMNTTADQQLSLSPLPEMIVRHVVMLHATIPLTTAAGGIYTQPNKGGVVVVPATQTYTQLTTPQKFMDLTLQGAVTNTVVNGQHAYFSLTTPQGAPATARLCIYGDTIN